jgi:glucose-6-phosphate isomerase
VEEEIESFASPDAVGGRFSVLTSVGLLPAAFVGIDIRGLLSGAREMRDSFLSRSFAKNMPFQIAVVQYLLNKKNKHITVMMPYAQKLFRFADWYRQLLAESIGKAEDREGKTVHAGLTPVNALGVTDQHSQSQLYNEGPNDKLFLFIAAAHLVRRVPIPNLNPKEDSVSFLKHTSFNELIDIEREGTVRSYTKNKRPNMTLTIDKIDARHLGQLFMLFEGATAILGEFFNINAFNQPGVELAKNLTKQLLLKKDKKI